MRFKEDFKSAGVYRFSMEHKKLIDAETKEPRDIEGNTTLVLVCLLSTGKTAYLTIKGMTKMDLLRLNADKSNKDKVDTFKNSVFLTLTPSSKKTTVGTGVKKKSIHLLEVESLDDKKKITEKQEVQIKGILETIKQELDRLQGVEIKKEDISEVFEEEDIPY